jgi:predicted membrane channel-forming protein YqfA (hemolysin III family)
MPLAGAAFKLVSFDRAHRIGAVLYIGLGWAGLALAPAVWHRGGPHFAAIGTLAT